MYVICFILYHMYDKIPQKSVRHLVILVKLLASIGTGQFHFEWIVESISFFK